MSTCLSAPERTSRCRSEMKAFVVVDTGVAAYAREGPRGDTKAFDEAHSMDHQYECGRGSHGRQRNDLAGRRDGEWQSRGDHCAREGARANDRAARPVTEWPLNTYFEESRDFFFNNEAVFLYHYPSGHTDGDSFVYFRGSDVLVSRRHFSHDNLSGDRCEVGWRRRRIYASLNKMLEIAVPKYLQEGGTYVIPRSRPHQRRGRSGSSIGT